MRIACASAFGATLAGMFPLISVLILTTSAFTQAPQPLNWSADDGARIQTLSQKGSRIDGDHMILWFPRSLSRADAQALVKHLDPAVAALWRRVGTHNWQAVHRGKITYYLSDDNFVAHATGRSAVFIPMV